MHFSVLLHNIRSAHNVGSIFRTADAAGVRKIYLAGYTPAPIDRFGRKDARIAKVALGAEEIVPWEKGETPELIKKLKKEGVHVVALEQSQGAIPFAEFQPEFPLALILGEEVEGIPKEILQEADAVIEIPMHGKKESLNVSVAAGVALFELAKKR